MLKSEAKVKLFIFFSEKLDLLLWVSVSEKSMPSLGLPSFLLKVVFELHVPKEFEFESYSRVLVQTTSVCFWTLTNPLGV
jgi:hypothetical protein